MSNEQMTKLKVIDLQKFFTFVVGHFLIEINFANE